MKMLKILLSLLLLMSFTCGYTLEIDEKLTFRILDISSTKKTLLMNRGIEDGLVVGDHAKFFMTTGVVARGVVIKVSPTRSIWSVYRLISSNMIVKNKVLNLKISAPVKLTEDPSKTLQETRDTGRVMIAPGANDIEEDLSRSEMDDLNALSSESASSSSSSSRSSSGMMTASWSPFAYTRYSSFGTTTVNDGTTELSLASTALMIGAGVEKYFDKSSGILSDFSMYVQGEVSMSNEYETGDEGASIKQMGIGASYHLLNSAFSYGKPILYVTFNGMIGTSSLDYSGAAADGSVMSVNTGGGLKYNFNKSFGIHITGLYSSRSESYTFSDSSISEVTVGATGFSFQSAISFRF